jgi:hypothetical protein
MMKGSQQLHQKMKRNPHITPLVGMFDPPPQQLLQLIEVEVLTIPKRQSGNLSQ